MFDSLSRQGVIFYLWWDQVWQPDTFLHSAAW